MCLTVLSLTIYWYRYYVNLRESRLACYEILNCTAPVIQFGCACDKGCYLRFFVRAGVLCCDSLCRAA